MLLRRKIKAGILLYALLMSAIFALLLQFYLGRVVVMRQQELAQVSASQAYLMAELTQDLADDEDGQLQFNLGNTNYHHQDGSLQIKVRLNKNQEFNYILRDKSQQEVSKESSVTK